MADVRILATPGPLSRAFGKGTLAFLSAAYALAAYLLWQALPTDARLLACYPLLVGYIVLFFGWRRGELVRDHRRCRAARELLTAGGMTRVRGVARPLPGEPDEGLSIAPAHPLRDRPFAVIETQPFVLQGADGRRIFVDPEHALLVSETGLLAYGDPVEVTGELTLERSHALGGGGTYRGDQATETLRGTEDRPLVIAAL